MTESNFPSVDEVHFTMTLEFPNDGYESDPYFLSNKIAQGFDGQGVEKFIRDAMYRVVITIIEKWETRKGLIFLFRALFF
jgi:hypothetical protein